MLDHVGKGLMAHANMLVATALLDKQHTSMPVYGRCELCGRDGVELTEHHLIPKSRHKDARLRKQFTLAEMRSNIAHLCRPCHSTVHAEIDEKTLARDYATVEALAAHPAIAAFTEWIAKRAPETRIPVRPRRR